MKYKIKSEKDIVEMYFNPPDMPYSAFMGYRLAIMEIFGVEEHKKMLYLRRKYKQPPHLNEISSESPSEA